MFPLSSQAPRIFPLYLRTTRTSRRLLIAPLHLVFHGRPLASAPPQPQQSPETPVSEKTSSGKTKRKRARRKAKKVDTTAASSPHLKIWRETLDAIKDLRIAQEQAMAVTGIAPKPNTSDNGTSLKDMGETVEIKTASKPKGKAKGKLEASSMESQAARAPLELPSQKALEAANADNQNLQLKVLTGALDFLRNILTTHPGPSPNVLEPAKEVITGSGAAESEADGHGQSVETPEPKKSRTALGPNRTQRDLRKTKKPSLETKATPKRPRPGEGITSGQGPKGSMYLVHRVNPRKVKMRAMEKPQPSVPSVQYGLDRVLFNPGVYHMQDPRSRVYNFDPYLATIMPISEFDFNALKRYVTSSKDQTLISLAAEAKKKYTGSTSSMTSTLAHFHYLISSWRPINPAHTSRSFPVESLNFTRIQRAPAAAFLHYKDGVYAIDADKEFDTANILSMLGKSMEKLLTLPKEEFEKYRRGNSDQLSEEERNEPEAFHYTTLGDFLMRSQLDAQDSRLPGSGMFDLKTRAVVSVRMDARDFHRGYEIRDRIGEWESFEREYFDMIRAAFLKYSLQVRMGRMDGIFVAFHNTERIFGFQYISINEMDLAIHGTKDRRLGDEEFRVSVHLLNKILDKATTRFPKQSLRLHFETRPSDPPFMYVFAKPVEPKEIDEVQNASKAAVEAFERHMMMGMVDRKGLEGLKPESPDEGANSGVAVDEAVEEEEDDEEGGDESGRQSAVEQAEEDGPEIADDERSIDSISQAVWEDMMDKVEEAMEKDVLGIASLREAIEHALEQSDLLRGVPPDQSRDYVDALLAAITSPDLESAAVDIHNSGSVTKSSESESLAAETEEGHAAVTPGRAVPEQASSSGNMEATSSSIGIADEYGGSSEGPQTEMRRPGAVDDTMSLKDLVLRLAAQAQAQPTSSGEGDAEEKDKHEPLGDSRRIRKFEKILSDMMSSSRGLELEPDSSKESGDAAGDRSGQSEDATTAVSPASPQPSSTPGSDVKAAEKSGSGNSEEVLGMIITVRNKVGGAFVKRPVKVDSEQNAWELQYSVEELSQNRTKELYAKCKKRRQILLTQAQTPQRNKFDAMFRDKIKEYSVRGRAFRSKEILKAKDSPLHVWGMDKTLKFEEVFGKNGPGPPETSPNTSSKQS